MCNNCLKMILVINEHDFILINFVTSGPCRITIRWRNYVSFAPPNKQRNWSCSKRTSSIVILIAMKQAAYPFHYLFYFDWMDIIWCLRHFTLHMFLGTFIIGCFLLYNNCFLLESIFVLIFVFWFILHTCW